MVQRTTTDPDSVRWHISKLENLRRRNRIRSADQYFVLRVFYGLYAEAHKNKESTLSATSVRAQERAANLCGKAKSTVSKIITVWVKAVRDEEETKVRFTTPCR